MRTVFVNPRHKRKRAKRRTKRRARRPGLKSSLARLSTANKQLKGRIRHMQMLANPRRRRHRRSNRRRHRRNAGITPFVANPLILNPNQNTFMNRRRRRNPGMGMPTLRTATQKVMTYGGGAALGAAANIFALNKIENDWFRNGARVAAAVFAGPMLKGEMGAAAAGALMYPVMVEIAALVGLPVETEADLDLLAADLEDVLSEDEAEELYETYA